MIKVDVIKEQLFFSLTDWLDIKGFTWNKYLIHTKASVVPSRAFKAVSYNYIIMSNLQPVYQQFGAV